MHICHSAEFTQVSERSTDSLLTNVSVEDSLKIPFMGDLFKKNTLKNVIDLSYVHTLQGKALHRLRMLRFQIFDDVRKRFPFWVFS